MTGTISEVHSDRGTGGLITAGVSSRSACTRRGLRVLMIVECGAGGTGRHVLDLSQGLLERRCDVHLIYSTRRIDKMFLSRLAEIQGLRHETVPMRTEPHPSDIGAVRAIRRYLTAHGPFDVIHGHSSKGGALARLAALATGVPAVYTLHGLIMMDPGLPRWKWLLYLSIELVLSLRTSLIIAVSPEEERAAKRLGLGQQRVILVPNGVGPAKLTPRDQARKALGVSDDALVIGFVGRLVEQKAPDVLVRAFAAALDVAPHARLALVGSGPLERPMRDLAQSLGVAEKIIWLGECDACKVMAAFDLLALSSRKEGLPYVVLEAMAAGLPVIATRSAGVEILIEPGVNGAVVSADNVEAFAKALIHLVTDPGRLAECGRASLARASMFTVSLMTDRTLDAYLPITREAKIQKTTPTHLPAELFGVGAALTRGKQGTLDDIALPTSAAHRLLRGRIQQLQARLLARRPETPAFPPVDDLADRKGRNPRSAI